MSKEPLYPHVSKSHQPQFPHATASRQKQTVLKIECMYCHKPMGEKPGGGVTGTTSSICRQCWTARWPDMPYPEDGGWVYAKVGTTEVRGRRVPSGIEIEQVSPTYDKRDFDKAVRIIEEKLKGQVLPQTIEGEPVPPQYRDLIRFISEPLPEYSLLTLPLVEAEVGETKLEAVMKQLKAGVEGIQDSHQFRLFLTAMSKFHTYSIGNTILIMLQDPNATHVAGFVTWKELGRWVKRGGKSISILAPRFPPRPTCPKCGTKVPKGAGFCPKCGASVEEGEIEVAPAYFIVVSVFDISQTEGKPLPEFDVPVLTGDVNEELFAKLLDLMKAKSVPVGFESRPHQDPGIKGQYSPASGIWVRPEEPRAQQLKTLAHETAHYYSEGVFRIPRQDAETIAESAAFVVGAHYGFDTGVRSFSYVAIWSQDKKTLERNLESIRRISVRMIDELE